MPLAFWASTLTARPLGKLICHLSLIQVIHVYTATAAIYILGKMPLPNPHSTISQFGCKDQLSIFF